jgi:hypothetical protein
LWDFSFNGLYVPLRVKTDNVMCYALLSNDYLSLYIKRKLELDESDNKSYVVFMKQILENQGILDVSGNDFEFYGFEKVTIAGASTDYYNFICKVKQPGSPRREIPWQI